MALRGRRINIQEWCPLGNHDPETDIHALVLCPFARSVWRLSSIGSIVSGATSFTDRWISLTNNHPPSEIDSAAMILWSIWNSRNDVVWNRNTKTQVVFHSALDLHNQWQQDNPPINFVKCNVDAAIFKDPPRMGYGCIIRYSSGAVIKCYLRMFSW
ncbi:uncharacterized protein [Henckelia pumila]|uniref:uncharacterized protein n=1 Tax=Henckelia pumila TaxID=405737 RepID=UPI003C6E9108